MSSESSTHSYQRPLLLAPAGNWDCAKAAVENGADAIYFGLEQFNARMRAQNFCEADLPQLMVFLHRRGVKGYLTLNTLIFPSELKAAEQFLRSTIAAGVDAVIVQDVGICRLIRHLSPDFPIHASTQMTVTSAAGIEFAKTLGCQLVVLARECSVKEINKIQHQLDKQGMTLPLEVFVHGALCVAYSGQCLTSESLGGRSANRGECAQACRMPYELIADGQLIDLENRKYLLSPQDLMGLEVLPELVKTGIHCLKIEGRLKTPEYVAGVTQVYRQALDRVMAQLSSQEVKYQTTPQEHYQLEMAFSRGLYSGWFEGINNQELVHAHFGKKRGVYLGKVRQVDRENITLQLQASVKPGDGVVFDNGHPEAKEAGGRIYSVQSRKRETVLSFSRHDFNWRKVRVGDKVWKTSDPELDRQLQASFSAQTPQFQRSIDLEISGSTGSPLTILARDPMGFVVEVSSEMPLTEANNKPLTTERLQEQLGRLGNTPFCLGQLTNHLQGDVMLPVSELNRLRREMVAQLEQLRAQPQRWQLNLDAKVADLLPAMDSVEAAVPELIVLVRNLQQLQATLDAGIHTLYCEFEDPRHYQQVVQQVRNAGDATIWVAPPRITKPGEYYILQQVRKSQADGYLVRNYDHLQFFASERCIGDFSLNVANPLTAGYFKTHFPLERLTASYDLNIQQLEDLLTTTPPQWFEVTIHQRMPMFHMEHCVFCAFLSTGTDYTNCGRPCEKHEVKLRDRVGTEHILQADAGCRNTLFNGTAQTGAEYVHRLIELGVRHFRLEFVHDTPTQVQQTIHSYQQLIQGQIAGFQLWQTLKLQHQLGVTRGPMGH